MALCRILLFAVAIFNHGLVQVQARRKGMTEIYDKILNHLENKTKYDSRIRPFIDEKPLEVTISLYVSSLRSISEATMDFKLELYFREYWQDHRLRYKQENYNNLTRITLHESIAKHLWLPDTFLPNAVFSSNPRDASISHRSLLRLDPEGTVLMSRRISVTAECPMDLTYYPFDGQVCMLSIESYGHDIDDVVYKWRDYSPVILNPDLQLPDFTIMRVETKVRNVTLTTDTQYSSGVYSRLECCFYFHRNAGIYFVQIFLPATAIVVTSWILLWMQTETTMGDMIEIILAMTFLYFSYTTVMPGVSYIKATDVFLGACFLFVFLALVKMGVHKMHIHKQKRRYSQRINKLEMVTGIQHAEKTRYSSIAEDDEMTGLGNVTGTSKDENTADVLYKTGKIMAMMPLILHTKVRFFMIFPIAFVIFCTAYFTVYLAIVTDGSQKKCNF